MQTPDLQEPKAEYNYRVEDLQLPLEGQDIDIQDRKCKDLGNTERKHGGQRWPVIVSSSPECNEFPSQENTWWEFISLSNVEITALLSKTKHLYFMFYFIIV